ncbi:hypothetical protein D3C75_439570 [compost metagenome]
MVEGVYNVVIERGVVEMEYGYIGVEELMNWLDGVIVKVDFEEKLSKSVWFKDKKYWDEGCGFLKVVSENVFVYDCMIYVKCKDGLINELEKCKEWFVKYYEL